MGCFKHQPVAQKGVAGKVEFVTPAEQAGCETGKGVEKTRCPFVGLFSQWYILFSYQKYMIQVSWLYINGKNLLHIEVGCFFLFEEICFFQRYLLPPILHATYHLLREPKKQPLIIINHYIPYFWFSQSGSFLRL